MLIALGVMSTGYLCVDALPPNGYVQRSESLRTSATLSLGLPVSALGLADLSNDGEWVVRLDSNCGCSVAESPIEVPDEWSSLPTLLIGPERKVAWRNAPPSPSIPAGSTVAVPHQWNRTSSVVKIRDGIIVDVRNSNDEGK